MRQPTIESELAANAAALRRLACDLVGRDDADDLVQETALRALGHPPARHGNLGAWLGTILRRLAGNHRRSDRRRVARHAALAGAEPEASADQSAARRESLNAVTQTLLGLAEPYRTTLFQRYFEELPPAAIAKRAQVPLATVKSRLQRGLTMLREALDEGRQHSRWRTALLPAVGLRTLPVTLPVTLTPTLILMTKASKVLVAAGLLAAIAFLCVRANEAPPEPPVATDEVAAVAGKSIADPAAAADDAPAREAVAPPSTLEATGLDLEHPFAFQLHCRVVDRDGLPAEGATILVAPHGTALNAWPMATDAAGCVDLAWRGRAAAMTVAIGVANDRLSPKVQELDLRSGANTVVLLGEAPATTKVQFLRSRLAKTAPAPAAEPPCQQAGATKQDCNTCHASAGFRGLATSGLQARAGLHPQALFGDLLLPPAPSDKQTAEEGRKSVEYKRVMMAVEELRVQEAVSVARLTAKRALARESPPDGGIVAGTVFDEQGKPVAGATVIWGEAPDRPVARTRSGKDGTFRFDGIKAANVAVRAGGAEAGIGTCHATTAAGVEARCELILRRGACITGRAVGRDGPLKGREVEYLAADGSWTDLATLRDDGTFVLANVPGPGRLLLLSPGNGLPVAIQPLAHPDAGEVVFDLRAAAEPRGALRLRPVPPKGLATHAEVRVWQVDSHCCAGMRRDPNGVFVLDGLMAGFYRVEIGAESCGWLDLAPVWIDGGGTMDLGTIALPQPGEVLLPDVADFELVELYARGPVGDIRAEAALAGRTSVALPAGNWLVFGKAGGRVAARAFAVSGGQATTVELGRR